MRIGFDGRWYNSTGVGNYVSELLQAMDGLDEDLEIVLYEDPRNPLKNLDGHRIRKVPVRAGRYSVREQFELPLRCLYDRLDVFHSPFYITPWFAPCPVVVTIHDLIPFLFKIYNLPKQVIIKMGYQMTAWKATRIISDSENTGDDLTRILGVAKEKIRVVHLAASVHNFHPKQDESEREYLFERYGILGPYVLTLSAKNWRTKNLQVVLEGLKICRRQVESRFQTVIVGPRDGFYEASRPDDVEVGDLVLTGFVPTSDLAILYRNAQVFLMASKYEGFGLPLLEAMSCGCAVVCSSAGSLAEVAGSGAILVDPEDAARMGEAVARLFCDQDQYLQQRARALRRATDFSWLQTAEQTVAVYSEAANTRMASGGRKSTQWRKRCER